MLISPPFLPARGATDTEDTWINRCMAGGLPGQGAFPVSFNLGWHGGMHLTAPANGNQWEPVRAIADGEVVFVRQPTPMPAGELPPDHPQAYGGSWTDNGVVVIRHRTEIGEGADATVTFFSITMHLNQIDPAIRQGRAVYRKAALGVAGRIAGRSLGEAFLHTIHLEIVCDQTQVARLAGQAAAHAAVDPHVLALGCATSGQERWADQHGGESFTTRTAPSDAACSRTWPIAAIAARRSRWQARSTPSHSP